MSTDAIQDDVRNFILEHIHSIEQIEVLLLLRRWADRDADAAAIARELRTAETSVLLRLEDLLARRLVISRREEGRTLWRYWPVDDELGRRVDALATCYATHRVSVIELVFSRSREVMRHFSEAFRLRKKD